MTALERAWYGPRRWLWLLWPLQLFMLLLVNTRRYLYQKPWLASVRLPVPVIVVGNITVGGTGKTPLVAGIVAHLREHVPGRVLQPGIVSRGYGARAPHYPYLVQNDSDVAHCGDEPLLLRRLCDVPVVVDPDRVRGAQLLIAQGCNIIVSDDGLQHYRLQRDIEISVVDAVRQLGNHWLLPAGPLREPASRLREVDLRVANGLAIAVIGEHGMRLQMTECIALHSTERRSLSFWQGQRVHAVAGIGNPARFFQQLENAGLMVEQHAFADHHPYTVADLPWRDRPILMTEKDAVKCANLNLTNAWFVRVQAQFDEAFFPALDKCLVRALADHPSPQ